MRILAVAALMLAVDLVASSGQATDAKLQAQLVQLFPAAKAFSPKTGEPPHFKAYGDETNRDAAAVVGYAFWTTELEPLERGYDGPIKILVGMDVKGLLTGILIVDHHEPYGDWSIEPPRFAAQFRGKNIRDPFRVGKDIDAVSRATITISSAARAVRNSARRVARQFIVPPAVARALPAPLPAKAEPWTMRGR